MTPALSGTSPIIPADSENPRPWRWTAIVATLACLLAGLSCQQPKIEKSALQIRQIQTRTFDIKDRRRAIKAVLNVLQDEAYIPKQANLELGYVYATKELDVSSQSETFWATLFNGSDARWRKNAIIECAANVTETHDGIRLRMSFQVKVMNNRGEVMQVRAIDDPVFYQNFFARIYKGVFYENEGV